MDREPPIRVAIIGGGLGGTVLMNKLLMYDHLDAHIYEAKDTFKERGASVGLCRNALRALDVMGLGRVVKDAGAVPVNGARCIIGEGPDEGKLVINVMGDLSTVHRAALLKELVDPIPEDQMHINKKLASIDGQTIIFEDGTTATADVIVGADGIHSSVRQFVLGRDHPAVAPVSAGMFDCRTVVPFEVALEKIGARNLKPEKPQQTIFVGNGMILFFDYIDESKNVCIVGAGIVPNDWEKTAWKHSVSRQWLLDQYQSWPKFAQEMVQLLCGDEEEIPAFIEWESSEAPRLFNGTMCMMGDAAHATTPWQGAGLGQAIEDAMIVGTALAECRSVRDVPQAFELYDKLMRPRGRRVVESSRQMGKMVMGIEGLDAGSLGQKMAPMWDFIHDWETREAVAVVAGEVKAYSNGTKE